MALTEEMNELDESLDKLTRKYTSNLRSQFGVGPQATAILLAIADALTCSPLISTPRC
ncbi:hypothetical protein ACTM9L_23450 [Citrobacter freundii]